METPPTRAVNPVSLSTRLFLPCSPAVSHPKSCAFFPSLLVSNSIPGFFWLPFTLCTNLYSSGKSLAPLTPFLVCSLLSLMLIPHLKPASNQFFCDIPPRFLFFIKLSFRLASTYVDPFILVSSFLFCRLPRSVSRPPNFRVFFSPHNHSHLRLFSFPVSSSVRYVPFFTSSFPVCLLLG